MFEYQRSVSNHLKVITVTIHHKIFLTNYLIDINISSKAYEFLACENMPKFAIDFEDRKPLGNTNEKISAIGIGTWGIRDYRKAEDALIYAIEKGINVIDTAESYGDGLAEELVGRVAKRVGRDKIFIITKLLPHRFTDENSIVKAMAMSLRRLNINYVDLVLIHWPNEYIPIETQVRYLETLAIRGFTRYIGVSNFRLKELEKAIHSTSKYEIVLNQVKYSVIDKKVEKDLLKFMIENRITLQAYTPIERGSISRNPILIEMANKYGKTTIQIALNYLISRPYVTAIPKSEIVQHIEEFIGALGWRLSSDDMEILEAI